MSLKDITEEAVGSIKPLLKAKIQEVKIMCDPDPFPSILLDKDIIWQVIINLLSNANRYGSIKSTIEVSITKKGKSAQYAIKNQGIGIPDNRKEKIFEKFFRAENAIKLVPEGSGLGLNLVKTIVLGWGGETWFDSEENRGATFYFTIPLSGMKAHKGEVKINI
jgi:signal transduction histidine kinase